MRIKAHLSPELALLASALSPTGLADDAFAGNKPLDWGAVLRLAERHRVVPALANAVAANRHDVPAGIRSLLDQRAHQAAFDELALAATIREVLSAFAAANIRAVILKGVPLSLMIHRRLGLRFSRDIDILVQPEQANEALKLMQAAGFLPRKSEKTELRALMRQRKDIELVNVHRKQIIELHWRLFDNPHLLPLGKDFPMQAVSLPTGLHCNVLPQRLNLLYLANHGTQHAWSRLKWLADFAALVARLSPDQLDALLAGTSPAEGQRSLTQGLILCEVLFAMPAPPRVTAAARTDWRVRRLVRIAIDNLVESGEQEIEVLPSGSTRKNISHYLIRSSPAYLASELWFDLTDFSTVPASSSWRRFGPLGRVGAWLTAKLSLATAPKDGAQ